MTIRAAGRITAIVLALTLLAACGRHHFRYELDEGVADLLRQPATCPPARFVVFSDPHVFDPRLGTAGSAFEKMMNRDRKMLPLSVELLTAAVAEMAARDADFVIVCGDLTKDGEALNHERFKELVAPLIHSGKRVFVIPGNHDVNNPNAWCYSGEHREAVASPDAEQFATLYRDFGYGQALSRDSDSLSYLVEPVPGLWLLALDSCRWKENRQGEHPVTGGSFSDTTLTWMEEMLIRASRERKAVITCMHHGLLEHYRDNAGHYPDYLVAQHDTVAGLLATYGVRLVFSGHFHSQDVSLQQIGEKGRFIADIETGSLVTYPSPWRLVTLDEDQEAIIRSHRIGAIPSHPEGFQTWARGFLFERTVILADTALAGYLVSAGDRSKIAPLIAQAMITHAAGDEPGFTTLYPEGMEQPGVWGSLVVRLKSDLLSAWQEDLPPGDNDLVIDLTTGMDRSLPEN